MNVGLQFQVDSPLLSFLLFAFAGVAGLIMCAIRYIEIFRLGFHKRQIFKVIRPFATTMNAVQNFLLASLVPVVPSNFAASIPPYVIRLHFETYGFLLL